MKEWSIFLRERSPLAAMVVICSLIATSTQYLVRDEIQWPAFGVSVIFLSAFLTLLRIMDEIKDVEKDRKIHPERPLARGLISVDAARKVVVAVLALLGCLSVASIALSRTGAILLAITVLYGFVIYREFWMGEVLGRNIFVFGLSHQLIVVPMYLAPVALASPEGWNSMRSWAYAFLSLGCSFSLEMSRKLDPGAPALARTYAQVHGRGSTVAANIVCLSVIIVTGYMLGLSGLILPLGALQLGALLVYWKRPDSYKLAAGLSVLTSLGQLLGPILQHFLGLGKAGA